MGSDGMTLLILGCTSRASGMGWASVKNGQGEAGKDAREWLEWVFAGFGMPRDFPRHKA